MSKLPPGWIVSVAGDVCQIHRGITFPGSAKSKLPTDGLIPCLRSGNVQQTLDWDDLIYVPTEFVIKESQYLQVNDVLVSMSNSNELVGKCSYCSSLPVPAATFGGFLSVLRTTVVEPKYLWYWLSSAEVQLKLRESANRTVNIANIGMDDIRLLSFPIAPLSEQQRIVAALDERLSELDASVAALERAERNLVRYRAAVLAAACSGRLVPTEADLARREGRRYEPADQLLARILAERRKSNTKATYSEPAQPDTSTLPKLPEGWVWATVEMVSQDTLIGLDRGRPEQRSEPPGAPYIKMGQVNMNGQVDLSGMVYVDVNADEAVRFAVSDGDLLFNTRNSRELVGKVGIVRRPAPGTVYNNNLMRIRPPTGVSAEYLLLAMTEAGFRSRMERVKMGTTNVAAVYAKDLLPLPIPLPPLDEQDRIVAEVDRHLSRADALAASIAQAKRRAQRLRRAILAAAFQGRLVPQDPHDEPASVLLERIRAQAAAAPATAPRRGRPPAPARAAEAAATYDAPAPKRRGRPPGSKNKAKA